MKLEWMSIKDAEKSGRSGKICACGGHNFNNAKKNLNHNSTKARHQIRIARKFAERLVESQKNLDPEISRLVDKYFWELADTTDNKH